MIILLIILIERFLRKCKKNFTREKNIIKQTFSRNVTFQPIR